MFRPQIAVAFEDSARRRPLLKQFRFAGQKSQLRLMQLPHPRSRKTAGESRQFRLVDLDVLSELAAISFPVDRQRWAGLIEADDGPGDLTDFSGADPAPGDQHIQHAFVG